MPTIDREAAAARAEKRQNMLGLYAPKEIAEMFGFDERTMAIWRSKNTGPRYTKLGKNVYYYLTDIHEWVARNVVETQGSRNQPAQESQFDMFPTCDCCNEKATIGTVVETAEGTLGV